MSLYLKSFLVFWFLYTPTLTSIFVLTDRIGPQLSVAVVGGLVGALAMSLLITRWHTKRAEQLGLVSPAEHYALHQRRALLINMPSLTTADQCVVFLCQRGWTLLHRTPEQISARSRASRWSSGEQITVTLTEQNSNQTHVQIESRPLRLLTLFDFGANRNNVEQFAAFLQQPVPPELSAV